MIDEFQSKTKMTTKVVKGKPQQAIYTSLGYNFGSVIPLDSEQNYMEEQPPEYLNTSEMSDPDKEMELNVNDGQFLSEMYKPIDPRVSNENLMMD